MLFKKFNDYLGTLVISVVMDIALKCLAGALQIASLEQKAGKFILPQKDKLACFCRICNDVHEFATVCVYLQRCARICNGLHRPAQIRANPHKIRANPRKPLQIRANIRKSA